MSNINNNIINSPAQTPIFDVSKLAAAAQLLEQQDKQGGFFKTASNKEKIENYFNLLKEYASMPGVSIKAVEGTFKHVTGIEYSAMEHKHMVAPAA